MAQRSVGTRWTIDDAPDQTGRVAVVTGANSGIGAATARALARLGATVVMACRTAETARAVRADILAEYPTADIRVVALDLADAESIERCADHINARHPTIDLVVANAGFIPTEIVRDADGVELGFASTFLGHFALIGRLCAGVQRAQAARVVTIGSLAHRSKHIDPTTLGLGHHPPMRAYAETKLAQLVFAQELDRRFSAIGSAAISLAAHPGAARTGVMRDRNRLIQRAYHSELLWPALRLFVNDADDGALPALRAATDPTAVGGEYFGPSGPFQLTGAPVRVPSIDVVRDPALGRRLWSFAETHTGISYP
ncbi:oxidoreductase [Gordonia hydrophobica]|uniref:Oxidoreductase n=1 Tax=Gordonia hydrophobica TaxID=40516 RepID=A0ABZ2TZZ5_9ACTN|nr:oxidoreductase [Gordonia hydrophobica]MBM7369411.1 NAD(P)-dependent dehydrogenase (short-subunit alcohol dehydrogenase family) [Gordonia hydrophobica]